MAIATQIAGSLQPDPALQLPVRYQLGRSDRQYIDTQIRGGQLHLTNSLLRGQIGTWFKTTAPLAAGDVVCSAGVEADENAGTNVTRSVTLANAAALASAGMGLGVALTSALANTWVRVAMLGIVGKSITGLASGAAGLVRINTTTGRCERVGGLAAADLPVGFVDGAGNLTLQCERAASASGAGLVVTGTAATGKAPVWNGSAAVWTTVGDVVGPASAVAGNLAALDATGKVISDSGFTTSNIRLDRRPLFSYTAASNDLVLADAGRFVLSNRSSAIGLRVRLQSATAWLTETELGGANIGAGTLTLTAEAGVTLNGSVTVPPNGWWWAKRTGTNVWQVYCGGGAGGGDLRSDGSVAMAADLDLGGNQVTNAGDASASTDLTTLQQVVALIAAAVSSVADWKQSVRAATTGALPANTRSGNVLTASANGALPAQDGVTLALNDRLLVKDEATGANRGIYTVTALGSAGAPWTLTRATDADTSTEVTSGMTCVAEEGAIPGKVYILTTAGTIVLNTTALSFTTLGTLSADGTSIVLTGSTLSIATGGVTTVKIADGNVTDVKLAVPYIKADGTRAWTGPQSCGNNPLTGLAIATYNGQVTSGGSTINPMAGAMQLRTLAANTTFTITTPSAPCAWRMVIKQDGVGGWTATFPVGVKWAGGAAPVVNTTPGAEDLIYFEYDGTDIRGAAEMVTIPTTFPPKGTENIEIDAWPRYPIPSQTIANGVTVNFDVPIAVGKRYQITADIYADNGAGGSPNFFKCIVVRAHQTGGAAAVLSTAVVDDSASAGWAWTAAFNGTDIRFSLANTSGSLRTFNGAIGLSVMDKP